MGCDRINIYRSFNYEEVIFVLSDKTINNDIYEDNAVFRYPDLINEYWLIAATAKEIIGCYRLHQIGAITFQVHANILPSFRKKYSLTASRLLLRWASENIENVKKIVCYIPDCFPNIEKHCLSLGFSKEGTVKKSYLKNGRIIDQHIYGIRGGKWEQPQQ